MTLYAHDYTILIGDEDIARTTSIAELLVEAGIKVRACFCDTGVIFAVMSDAQAESVLSIDGVDVTQPGRSHHFVGGAQSVLDPPPKARHGPPL